MPYRFAGTTSQDGVTRYLLVKDGRTLAVSEGMVIDRDYRVDVSGANPIALIHLPTGVRQVVPASQATWPPYTDNSTPVDKPTARPALPPGVVVGPGSPVRRDR